LYKAFSIAVASFSFEYAYSSANAGFVFTDAFKLKNSVLFFRRLRAALAQVVNDASPYALNLLIIPLFFSNKIGLDVVYYKSRSRNQILPITVPSSTGLNSTGGMGRLPQNRLPGPYTSHRRCHRVQSWWRYSTAAALSYIRDYL
jgi:hypothetical protein